MKEIQIKNYRGYYPEFNTLSLLLPPIMPNDIAIKYHFLCWCSNGSSGVFMYYDEEYTKQFFGI